MLSTSQVFMVKKWLWVSSMSTFFIISFHMGAIFCFFPAILLSSTFTDKNNPRIISYLLSFQGYPPILKAVRLLHRYHRIRREERRNNFKFSMRSKWRASTQETGAIPRNPKPKIKRGMTRRIRKTRWQIFLTGYRISKKSGRNWSARTRTQLVLQNQI